MIYTTAEFFRVGYNKIEEMADPRVKTFPLLGSPIPVTVILTIYVSFIFKIGPRFMAKRRPYELKAIIKYYNIIQIIANSIGVILGIQMLPDSSLLCMPLDRSTSPEAKHWIMLHYLYLILKIFDLFDTVFFVLRKKYEQITVLHFYHHFSMVVGTWATCYYVPGGQLYFLGFVNCFVHVVMYFYYYLTSLDSRYKNSIWLKKNITRLQIIIALMMFLVKFYNNFFLIFSQMLFKYSEDFTLMKKKKPNITAGIIYMQGCIQHCFIFASICVPLANPYCTYPKLLLGIYLPWVALMIYLFSKFYAKAYGKERERGNKTH